MDGAAAFQVADEGEYAGCPGAFACPVDGEEIEQGLGRMPAGTVTAAGMTGTRENSERRGAGGAPSGGASPPHREWEPMILMESARVSPFLALVLPPSAKPMMLPPRALDGSFERQSGTGGGLEEAAGDQLVFQQAAVGFGLQPLSGGDHQFHVGPGQIRDGDDVFVIERIGHRLHSL